MGVQLLQAALVAVAAIVAAAVVVVAIVAARIVTRNVSTCNASANAFFISSLFSGLRVPKGGRGGRGTRLSQPKTSLVSGR